MSGEFSIDSNGMKRLVFDRETGKPKGFGFCEFQGVFPLDMDNH